MNEIVLAGCTATPLANYLKALGILRLLSAKYPDTRGFWRNDTFVLRTDLDRTGIEQFFLHEYKPTPIISPWSGRAGFLEGGDDAGSKRKGAAILARVEKAKGDRFQKYKAVITSIRAVSVVKRLDHKRVERKYLEKLNKNKKLDEDGKKRLSHVKRDEADLKGNLLLAVRSELDDSALAWTDACFALAAGERTPGPLLGSGGNEGSMDFSINHVDYLLKLINENTDQPTRIAEQLLTNTLFGVAVPYESSSNIGFLDTLATGGVNMSTGFEGGSNGNIWDSVLAMEGAVLFATTSTKRLESTASGRPSFPFAVSPSFAGSGSLATEEKARPELWLPTWKNPAAFGEVVTLLAEGRVAKGKHQAANGIDMLEAIASLGGMRGVTAFNRYGFYERRGQGYFVATHLGRFKVPASASDNWLIRELSRHGWLDHFRRFTQGDTAANRFRTLRKRLEDQLFDLSGHKPTKDEMQSLLILLGNIQQALASSSKARESVLPLPRLSERWAEAADDGSPEFRIAKALAGLHGVSDEPLPLRAQLFPVHRQFDQWLTPEAGEKVRIYTREKGRLVETLHLLLECRLQIAERLEMKDKPLASPAGATLDDITAFLHDDRMDTRIAALLPGLCLCAIPEDMDRTAGEGVLPAAFGLMKLALTPDRTLRSFERKGIKLLPESEHIPVPAGMLAQLAAGNHENRAVEIAWRRLRSSALTPCFTSPGMLPTLAGISPLRAAAALLIPLRFGASGMLTRTLLQAPETDPATTA